VYQNETKELQTGKVLHSLANMQYS